MKFEYNEETGLTQVAAEIEDRCLLCDKFEDCPLIQALEINLVYPCANKLQIEDCPMFEMADLT